MSSPIYQNDKSMDDPDRDLLSALRNNARTSVSSLAATTGASRATVAARIERLVENGVITGFTIRTGHETRAAGVRAIIMIEVLGKMADRVADQLRGLPQVRAPAQHERQVGISSPSLRIATSPPLTKPCVASA